ncbi:MAG: ComEC/Rec2 family competence protein [Clostridiaceae bacterium]|nr:ComEC/Rec2 family competence protein [Clostridiaceae bacterium]
MSRPFVSLCISLIIGILLYNYIYDSYIFTFTKGSVFIILFGCLLLIMLFSNKYNLFIYLIFILLGGFLYHSAIAYPTILKNYTAESIDVEGRVIGMIKTEGNYREYDIKITGFNTNAGDITVKEKARLKYLSIENPLQPGDTIKIKNAIIKERFTEEGLQGYKRYLRSRGYNLMLEATSGKVTKIKNPHNINIMHASYSTRKYIEDFFDASLGDIESGLLKSIMFGNQGYMSREMLAVFSASGTAHIVAVSGLHVGIMVLLIHAILRFFQLGKEKILISTMIILWLYGYMVGFPVSIIRASAMYYFYVFAYFAHRKYDGINVLMMIAFFLLLSNPFHLFSVSFQLSFAATLSILMFYPIIKEGFDILPKALKGLLTVTIAAQIGTIPIIAYHFQQISLISFVANLFIVPVLAPLLAMAFLSIFSSLLPLGMDSVINYLVNNTLSYIYWIAATLSELPFASVKVENINILPITIYYGILTIVYLIIWSYKQQKRKGMNTYELQGSNEKVKGQ